MGNICTSSANYAYPEGQSIPNTDDNNTRSNKAIHDIDKWSINDVYQWLLSVDDGVLYELAIKCKEARIRGCVLDKITDKDLVEMKISLGDRMLFHKVKNELFVKYNYHSIPNNILSSSHDGNHSDINLSHSNDRNNNNNNKPNTSHDGDLCHIDHSQRKSMRQQPIIQPIQQQPIQQQAIQQQTKHIMHYPMDKTPHLLSNKSVTQQICNNNDDDNFVFVEENEYAAIDQKHIEGIEEFIHCEDGKDKKTSLKRSCSSDQYTKSTALPFQSISNPTGFGHYNLQKTPTALYEALTFRKQYEILKIAKLLKYSLNNELKTVPEIIEIIKSQEIEENMDSINNEKYKQILEQLLKLNLLIFREGINYKKMCKLQFNHPLYRTMTVMMKQSKSCSNIPRYYRKTQRNTQRNYCGGTQVIVFSPKSNQWRQGIVLNYDKNRKMGRICCYDDVRQRYIKEISLPNIHVKPTINYHHSSISPNIKQQNPLQHIPMTVESWNNNYYQRQ